MNRLLTCLLLLTLAACKREETPAPEQPAASAAPDAPATAPATSQAASPPAASVPRAFLCRGNEPFWSLDIRADGALLKTPEAETAVDGALRASSQGSFAFTGAPDGSPADSVEALISPAQCFDTMADGPASPFSAQVTLPGGQAGSGCCTAEFGLDLDAAPVFDAATKAAGDWTRDMDSLALGLGKCVSDSGVATDVATIAYVKESGRVAVWLRDSSGQRFECEAEADTGRIVDIRPVLETEAKPGEGQPLWIPARQGPPILGCGRVERVMVGGDAVVGYLHYTDGCG